MTDDFSDYPKSITEVKADKSGKAIDWTYRDLLIDTLRRIDSNELKPDALVVCWRETVSPGRTSSHFAQKSPDIHTSVGLLEYAKMAILTDEE